MSAKKYPSPGEAKRLVTEIAQKHELTYDEVVSRSQLAYIVRARHEAIRALVEKYYDETQRRGPQKCSYTWIGRQVNRDHTTVVYVMGRIKKPAHEPFLYERCECTHPRDMHRKSHSGKSHKPGPKPKRNLSFIEALQQEASRQ